MDQRWINPARTGRCRAVSTRPRQSAYERKRIPLIIDLERVVSQGRRPEQNLVMERGAT